MFTEIAEGVFLYRDICNVYLLKSEEKALLIDFGSGSILECLKEIGVSRLEVVLLTHEHRDQCLGIKCLAGKGVEVLAPLKAKDYLGEAEVRHFWNEHFPLEFSLTCYSVLTEGCDEIKCTLTSGDFINWEGIRLEVLDAAGHSPGQSAYLLHHPDGRFLFCGDSLFQGGRLWKGYTLDWDHSMDIGTIQALRTAERLKMAGPSLIAPSHGDVIEGNISRQLDELIGRLETYAINRVFNIFKKASENTGRSTGLTPVSSFKGGEITGFKLTEHLWIQYNSYFILSETGQCLMVDCGINSIKSFMSEFLRMTGRTSVDVVIPTHPHEDHVSCFSHMKENYRTEIWLLDILQDIVQTPWKYWHPWARWQDVKADRVFTDGDRVKWNEYELVFHWYPGQTAYALAVETVIDGRKVIFTGDNYYPVGIFGGTGGVMGVNRGVPEGYRYSTMKTMDIKPDWILAAHGNPFEYNEEEFRIRLEWTYALRKSMEMLTPEGIAFREAQFDPHAMSVYPFTGKAVGGRASFRLVGEGIENGLTDEELLWDLPSGFEVVKADTDSDGYLPKGIFTCMKLNSTGNAGVLPFSVKASGNVEKGKYGMYVSLKKEPSMEAMFIVEIT